MCEQIQLGAKMVLFLIKNHFQIKNTFQIGHFRLLVFVLFQQLW